MTTKGKKAAKVTAMAVVTRISPTGMTPRVAGSDSITKAITHAEGNARKKPTMDNPGSSIKTAERTETARIPK